MDSDKSTRYENNRLKLTQKKKKLQNDIGTKKSNRSSDVIILDESLDKLRLEVPEHIDSTAKIYSPIVINDSNDLFDEDLPKISLADEEPSKKGNVSFNCSSDSPTKESQPSMGSFWSPAQPNLITANCRNNAVPSTPKDVAHESHEQCSIKKIEQSQKILNDLYGDSWKSIPKLFKTIKNRYENFNGITKKLFDDDGDKENIRDALKINKQLYLTSSDVKRNETKFGDTEKKCKKKLYTEEVPNTPDVIRPKNVIRNVNSTTKKVKIKKGMSVTELVEIMRKESDNVLRDKIENDNNILKKKGTDENKSKEDAKIDRLTKKIAHVTVTPKTDAISKRLSFVGSLADDVPSWKCHIEAIQYRDNYKNLREQLTRRLYSEFNKHVFNDGLDADMSIIWDSKLRSTAGTTTSRVVKNANGERIYSCSIKLSIKVLDAPYRLRDTLIHEMCHAATWLIDGVMKAGHGPLWKKWAKRALKVYPELGEISRCHDLEIYFKYTYVCSKCGYSFQRHSKSIDIQKKCCGYCRGKFDVVLNKKNKDGVVTKTPARKCAPNGFSLFVKENYVNVKDGSKTHAQVMKLLSEQYSAKKSKVLEEKL